MKPLEELNKIYLEKLVELGLNQYDAINTALISSHSTVIEGCTLTIDEALSVIVDNTVKSKEPKNLDDFLMVKSHQKALDYALELAISKTVITESHLKQINTICIEYDSNLQVSVKGDDGFYFLPKEGEYRKVAVRAGSTIFPRWEKIEPKIKEQLLEIEKFLEAPQKNIEQIYEFSYNSHYKMVALHPWLDGNGRTTRIVMNYIQAFYNLPLTAVIPTNKNNYIKALKSVVEAQDNKHYLQFMKQQHQQHLSNEITRLELEKKKQEWLLKTT